MSEQRFKITIQPEGKVVREYLTKSQADAWAEQFNRALEGTKHEGSKRAEAVLQVDPGA